MVLVWYWYGTGPGESWGSSDWLKRQWVKLWADADLQLSGLEVLQSLRQRVWETSPAAVWKWNTELRLLNVCDSDGPSLTSKLFLKGPGRSTEFALLPVSLSLCLARTWLTFTSRVQEDFPSTRTNVLGPRPGHWSAKQSNEALLGASSLPQARSWRIALRVWDNGADAPVKAARRSWAEGNFSTSAVLWTPERSKPQEASPLS